MNTHILISIKDIDERINHLKKELTFTYKDYKTAIGTYSRHQHAFLMSLSRGVINDEIMGKQISLDEKDIEENNYMDKAKNLAEMNNYAKDNDTFLHGVIVGYKQALLDLK